MSCLGAAPVFNSSSYSGTVDENVPTDTTVSGIALSASDSDGDSITISIISSAGPFKLSGDGLSVLTNGLAIDFESQNSYSLTVQAEAAGKRCKAHSYPVAIYESYWIVSKRKWSELSEACRELWEKVKDIWAP